MGEGSLVCEGRWEVGERWEVGVGKFVWGEKCACVVCMVRAGWVRRGAGGAGVVGVSRRSRSTVVCTVYWCGCGCVYC